MTTMQDTPPRYQLLGRVASYSLVNFTYQKVVQYYKDAKQSSPYVKYGLEAAESRLVKVTTPVVENLGYYCEPYLRKADDFGCKQLDKLETSILKPAEEVGLASKRLVEEKVEVGKEIVNTKILDPVTTTYNNLKSLPLALTSRTLDFAESFVDYLIPEPEVEVQEHEQDTGVAPATSSKPEETQKSEPQVTVRALTRRVYNLPIKVTRRAGRRIALRVNASKTNARNKLNKAYNTTYASVTYLLNYLKTIDRKTLTVQNLIALTRQTLKDSPVLFRRFGLNLRQWIQVKTGGANVNSAINYFFALADYVEQLVKSTRKNLRQRAEKLIVRVKTRTGQTFPEAREPEVDSDNDNAEAEGEGEVAVPLSYAGKAKSYGMAKAGESEQEDDDGAEADSDTSEY
jgi:hypothetical protein